MIKGDPRLSLNEQKIVSAGKDFKTIFGSLVFYLIISSALALFGFLSPENIKLFAIVYLIISLITTCFVLSSLYSIATYLESFEPEFIKHGIHVEDKKVKNVEDKELKSPMSRVAIGIKG